MAANRVIRPPFSVPGAVYTRPGYARPWQHRVALLHPLGPVQHRHGLVELPDLEVRPLQRDLHSLAHSTHRTSRSKSPFSSLPGALGMFGLGIGASHIAESLPRPVYAILSGLNAAVVGFILVSAISLSQRAITDHITRLVVFLTAAAGLLYNALWYFPVLLAISGCATLVHDYRWLHPPIIAISRVLSRRRQLSSHRIPADTEEGLPTGPSDSGNSTVKDQEESPSPIPTKPEASASTGEQQAKEEVSLADDLRLNLSWKVGAAVAGCYLAIFVAVMVLRGVLSNPPLLYSLFANMLLAGTIIFGGGPVVIPLLREYVVAQGWVSPRDFLLGVALIQAFPGPNFNFSVYLGTLAAAGAGLNPVAGAVLAWAAFFLPGLSLVRAAVAVWSRLRGHTWIRALLRGINAGAVGLVYTAVYRLWQVGYIDAAFQTGRPLADDPWWLVVAATAFVAGHFYSVPAPIAILSGTILGLVWYGVISSQGG